MMPGYVQNGSALQVCTAQKSDLLPASVCLQVTWKDFHAAINAAKPGFIRVEADELTYDFHIMLRTELEAQLLTGELSVSEVPAAWNAAVKDLLDVEVPDDARGCLQVRATRLSRPRSRTILMVTFMILSCCAPEYSLVWRLPWFILLLHDR